MDLARRPSETPAQNSLALANGANFAPRDEGGRAICNKKSRGQSHGASGRGLSYFKLPVDGDDEESLEERRGRTVLRTAMWSAQANRYYGPPDGIQPEFDLFADAKLDEHGDA